MKNKTIEIAGKIISETDMAIRFFDGDDEHWLPKSQIDYDEPDLQGNTIVEMPEWLAIEKGIV